MSSQFLARAEAKCVVADIIITSNHLSKSSAEALNGVLHKVIFKINDQNYNIETFNIMISVEEIEE